MIAPESIIAPIAVLGFLIFFHELGHFLVAKWCKVGVLRFSVGFGPAIYKKRIGETVYQLSVIPLGGYVRMAGDMPDMITGPQETDEEVRGEAKEAQEEEEQEELPPEVKRIIENKEYWFLEKNLWQRSAIVFAGPWFNFVLAAILVFLSVALYGEDVVNEGPVIGQVVKSAPAGEAGLVPDDEVIAIGDQSISSWKELAETIRDSDGSELVMTVRRPSGEREVRVVPEKRRINDPEQGMRDVYLIGIGPSFDRKEVGLVRAAEVGVKWTGYATYRVVVDLWGLITGRVSTDELAGPLFILEEAGRRAKRGLEDVLSFMAILSVSLAVLNLLPIPVLDGGHLLFFIIEGLFGPISIKKKEAAQQLGFVALLCLMILALHNDIFVDRSPPKESEWEEPKDREEDKTTSKNAAVDEAK